MLTWEKLRSTVRWLPTYLWQTAIPHEPLKESPEVIIAVADHFEPGILPNTPRICAPKEVQRRRVMDWIKRYPGVVDSVRDSEGIALCHTYFFPAEQYDRELIEMLASFCRDGWGEIEIHLHHGVDSPDTSTNTRRMLENFRDTLVRHGCLARDRSSPQARYAFVHGNWSLANSGKRYCGVDDEMRILAETGCYADFTFPAAPDCAQTAKINSIYECALSFDLCAPHRRGHNLRVGKTPSKFPLILQGPLGLAFRGISGRRRRFVIENSELASLNPPTVERMKFWVNRSIHVTGRPEWIFIKLHCHGMDPRDGETLLGEPLRRFLSDVRDASRQGIWRTHFVTAREMVNIALAACDGHHGNPESFRDYRLVLIQPHR